MQIKYDNITKSFAISDLMTSDTDDCINELYKVLRKYETKIDDYHEIPYFHILKKNVLDAITNYKRRTTGVKLITDDVIE